MLGWGRVALAEGPILVSPRNEMAVPEDERSGDRGARQEREDCRIFDQVAWD